MFGSGNYNYTLLIISNNEMKKIVKIVESFEDSGFLPEGVGKTIQNEVKEQRGGFLSISLGILGANLLGNNLADKGVNRTREGVIAKTASKESKSERQGQGIVRAGYGNKQDHKNNMNI